jgi:hypothetical protein
MFNLLRALFVSFMLMFSYNASADFWSGNDCPPWEYDCNDWPEWTPMYWMEEFSDEFDNNDNDWYRYGGGGYAPYGGRMMGAPWGGPMPYGPPPMPYGGPYGGPMGGGAPYGGPMPYGPPPAPPYGGPMGGPMGPGPYGAPPAPPAQ